MLCADIAEGKTVDLRSYIAIDEEIGREVARVMFEEVVTFKPRGKSYPRDVTDK